MSKLIITKMEISGHPCTVCALEEGGKVMELRLEQNGTASLLGNIYIGQVENMAANIQAAFVRLPDGIKGYFPLAEQHQLIYTCGRKGEAPLRAGDEILVQVSRDAMKGKLPALTANLNFTGKYLVLTTGNKKFGLSSKLSRESKNLLCKWLQEEIEQPNKAYGLVVRTNAAEATKEELLHELSYLKQQYEKVAVQGRYRTCFSCLYEAEPFYLSALRDVYDRNLEAIQTDEEEIFSHLASYMEDFCPEQKEKLSFYRDSLLPLHKLYRLESALDEIRQEKIWLKSGGFLVIQQTEAFVSIDVNSGKYTGKKKAEETYRKINLEAAKEIARQLRLRNLSGIILIDFINMEHPDHKDELFHVLAKEIRRDPVKGKVIDFTALNIMEMTRKKVRRPVLEDLKSLY